MMKIPQELLLSEGEYLHLLYKEMGEAHMKRNYVGFDVPIMISEYDDNAGLHSLTAGIVVGAFVHPKTEHLNVIVRRGGMRPPEALGRWNDQDPNLSIVSARLCRFTTLPIDGRMSTYMKACQTTSDTGEAVELPLVFSSTFRPAEDHSPKPEADRTSRIIIHV